MNKKILSLILVMVALATCLLTLVACDNNGATPNQTSASDYVKFGKKYYRLSDNNVLSSYNGIAKNHYVVIYQDNTAEYYYKSGESGSPTTNYFKWTYADDGVLLLVNNGVKSDRTSPSVESCMMLACTKNVIVSDGSQFYVCEDYLDQIPNNGKIVE